MINETLKAYADDIERAEERRAALQAQVFDLAEKLRLAHLANLSTADVTRERDQLKSGLVIAKKALYDLLPGLVLDRRHADEDDDIEALDHRIKTVTDALNARPAPLGDSHG